MENHWDDNENKQSNFSSYGNSVKILIQGIPPAVLSVGVTWFLFFVGLDLFLLDPILFLGLIGGLLLLILIVFGFTNSLLAEALWNIKPNRSVLGFIGQGLLFILLIAMISPAFIIVFLFLAFSPLMNTIALILTTVLLSFIGGYLGKNIATEFEPTESRKEELRSVHDRHVSCPNCNNKFTVTPHETDESGGIICSGCGKWLSVFDRSPSL
ncbi:MAG: TFIIB-type zinc ribbon-containing protein [Candidatus Thorarchaeota archaeon]|nr:TFIIB-type zinc ribbon-containing protein [Candidatus Thorarchaeota archaeon]